MSFFKEVEGDAAVIVENGVYKQVPLATRDGYLYVKTSGGYVRLMADGSTSKGKLRLEFMTYEGLLMRDALGRLCTPDATKAVALEDANAKKLLGYQQP